MRIGPTTGEDVADLFARRSIAIARGVVGAVIVAYSLSTGFGGVVAPSYARVVGALAGAGFLISAIADLLSGGYDAAVSRTLIVVDVVLVAVLLFALVEDPGSYEYVVVAWVAVEAGTAFGVRKTLMVAGFLAAASLAKDMVSVTLYDHMYDTAGILVRISALAAVALVTSSYSTAMQSKRLLHEERGRASRLREIDETKTMFIRAVAHDFKSPLAVVTGMAELIVGRAERMSPDQLQQLSGTILKNGRKLESLVGDLMDSERLSHGVLRLDRTETDLADLVRTAIDDVDMRGHLVEADLPSVKASVDAPKVERVIENLLANAAKHTVSGTQVWVSLRDEATHVTVVVEDSGGGVPDELKEEIFQPFVQGTENAPGTGVGLSLVRGIAELHGGRAWVEDRETGGSAFKVTLPKGLVSG
jgi:signal transduction histidine kinase